MLSSDAFRNGATPMTDRAVVPLRPGDCAPDFDLPAADHDGRVALREYLGRGPVLMGIKDWSGPANFALSGLDTAFQMTPEDEAEISRPLQTSGLFLIGTDGLVRWTQAPTNVLVPLRVEELLARF